MPLAPPVTNATFPAKLALSVGIIRSYPRSFPWDLERRHLRYCSSLTCSIQSTAFPFRDS
jgi:hypothetical protein